MKKVDARKQTREELHYRRQQVISLHRDRMPVMKIVEETGLSWPAVNAAIKLFKAGNDFALKPAQRGRKQRTGRILSEEKEIELHNIICRKRPWQLGIKHSSRSPKLTLWSRDAVRRLIELKYKTALLDRCLAKYLVRWGFSPTVLKRRPYERCSKDIKKWLDDNYTSITQRSKAEDAEICWVSKTMVIKPDEWPAYEKNGRPLSLSMVTAINNRGKVRWLIVSGMFTPKQQINFLKALVNGSRKKTFMILDKLSYYKKKQVTDWIALNDRKIELFPTQNSTDT